MGRKMLPRTLVRSLPLIVALNADNDQDRPIIKDHLPADPGMQTLQPGRQRSTRVHQN